ncbi:MAG: hypothetical protein GAK35_04085 [Herbaspirillum frisingense]|uniref:Uncharacterized protein n=1 Tax=Herbaspirillum frisingense TaxID=92645 RepID=A0A7V8JS89_9BURK|nr:MAG: hypothetical protein GAK35_04085 [Herbaspirillum frisingense]
MADSERRSSRRVALTVIIMAFLAALIVFKLFYAAGLN